MSPMLRFQGSAWLLTLLASGVVAAGETDALFTRLADAPLLTPRFQHLDALPPTDPVDRDSVPAAWPVLQPGWQHDPARSLTTQALTLSWQHGFDGGQRFLLGARLSEQMNIERGMHMATGGSASFGMSQSLGVDSLLSGRLFLGDEDNKDRTNGYGTRRYYGLQFEGRTALWRDHAPFASLSWQRNDYEDLEATGLLPGTGLRSESISRFGAGWDWRISPAFDVRAEARYRLTEEVSDPAEQDRMRFFFRSRYGFR